MKATYGLLLLFLATGCQFTIIRTSFTDGAKCQYGERGSLTATCYNATPSFFKITPYRFDQLDETLRCANCTLTTLESSTFDISGNQIKHLDLRYSHIQRINQKAFVGLIFLEVLDLSHNDLTSLIPGTFIGVKKIISVDLTSNQITSIPADAFAELVNLKELLIKYNKIQIINPGAFRGLSLTKLDLSYNSINNITDTFNLTSLQDLNLENNQITELARNEFSNTTGLLRLNLRNNKLRTFSFELSAQHKLVELDMSSNYIEILPPDCFRGMKNLMKLNLSYNQITEVTQNSLRDLYSLTTLSLNNNKLKVAKTGVYSGLPQLQELNLANNSIEDFLVTGVFSLHSLHSLILSNNKLSDLDYVAMISRLPKLSYLDLEDNLLPCDLEQDMQVFFKEDNFKFLLFSDKPGAVKCVEVPLKQRKFKEVTEKLMQRSSEGGSRSAEVTIFVFIAVIVVLLGVLFYSQFRIYQRLQFGGPGRATSTVHLINPDADIGDLRE